MAASRVTYIHSKELARVADQLPSNLGRASLVHHLISSYDLLDNDTTEGTVNGGEPRARVMEPIGATKEELCAFHDEEFIDSLLGTSTTSDSDSVTSSSASSSSSSSSPRPSKRRKISTSLVDDCPPFPSLPQYVPLVAGASMTAARELRDGKTDFAISWTGGRHHATRGEAKGFCYVNDIVLAIMELRKKPIPPPSSLPESDESPPPPPSKPLKRLSKILYLDLDLHHGDGVESAFFTTPQILTLSVHLHAPLFFPSTGSLSDSGPTNPKAPGRGHALNLALESGLKGEGLKRVWKIVEEVKESFGCDAVVVQCGVDGLAGDPCKEWNLSTEDLGECMKAVLEWNLPTLLLGGGGYSSPNAARTWTYLTSICLNRTLPLHSQIPSSLSSSDYTQFSPSFTLDVERIEGMKDLNNDITLGRVEEVFEGYCRALRERWKTRSQIRESIERGKEEKGKGKKRVRFEIEDEEENEERVGGVTRQEE